VSLLPERYRVQLLANIFSLDGKNNDYFIVFRRRLTRQKHPSRDETNHFLVF